MEPTRVPPHNLEAEAATLGAMLLDARKVPVVAEILTAADFYRADHQAIFAALVDLYTTHGTVDLVLLRQALKGKTDIDYLVTLMDGAANATHAEHYAGHVEGAAVKRRVIGVGQKLLQVGYGKEKQTAPEVMDEALAVTRDLWQAMKGYAPKTLAEALQEVFDAIDGKAPGIFGGWQTGFYRLDELLGGLRQGQLVIVAGRPGMGKTSFVLDLVSQMGVRQEAPRPVGMISLEMGEVQLGLHIACAIAHVSVSAVYAAARSRVQLASDKIAAMQAAQARISEAPIHIREANTPTPMRIRAIARQLVAECKIEMLVIDYLQLMRGDGKHTNRVQEISEITRALKLLARELDIPIVLVSQLSRAVENRDGKRPQLSDLRDSGSIEQDADVVLFVYRVGYYSAEKSKTEAEIIVAKNREGPTGDVFLTWDESHMTFKNPADTPTPTAPPTKPKPVARTLLDPPSPAQEPEPAPAKPDKGYKSKDEGDEDDIPF